MNAQQSNEKKYTSKIEWDSTRTFRTDIFDKDHLKVMFMYECRIHKFNTRPHQMECQ